MLMPGRLLVASEDFGERLPAARVASAVAAGLVQGGLPQPDLCPLPHTKQEESVRELLDELGFDTRMRASRAVVVAAAHLHERTLDGSMTFEIATRARQAGVPAYALTAQNELAAFDARMLDLQVILEARGTRALTAAARKLAGLV